MKNLIPISLICILLIISPKVYADVSTNSDFNPFPQMEQDLSNTQDQAENKPEGQNDDWPPVNSDTPMNSETSHE